MKKLWVFMLFLLIGCAAPPKETTDEVSSAHHNVPVGLGIYFVNGAWNPDLTAMPDPNRPTTLSVIRGYDRVVQELYLASILPTTEEDGPTPLMDEGDFSYLDWSGLEEVGDDWRMESNGATYQRQVFYRGAAWMEDRSTFTLTWRSAGGGWLDQVKVKAGRDDRWKESDDFGERRFVVRVLSMGCPAVGDCTGATHLAEALVQLRVAQHPEDDFGIPQASKRLDVKWSADDRVRTVPVTVKKRPVGASYGLSVDLATVSSPSRGYYLPGEQVSVRITYRDREGVPIFQPGVLPSYGAAMARDPSAMGLRYLSFNAVPMLYWKAKPQQAAMQTFLAGPVHKMTTVGTYPITPAALFAPEITSASHAVDGWSAIIQETPITPVMFSCLLGFDPAACVLPTPDVFTFTLPADAESGTWIAGVKARREWEGEPALTGGVIKVQVGQTAKTYFPGFPVAGLEPCTDCHSGGMDLKKSSHGFDLDAVAAQCVACHTDGYYFEPDAGIGERLVYLHAQSNRLDPP